MHGEGPENDKISGFKVNFTECHTVFINIAYDSASSFYIAEIIWWAIMLGDFTLGSIVHR